METQGVEERWQKRAEEVVASVAQWRQKHPKATLAQIERAVDEQMNRLRAQLIEEAAQLSEVASAQGSQGRVCEQCGQALQARGKSKRRWQTQGGHHVELERMYVSCPQCGGGLFPPG